MTTETILKQEDSYTLIRIDKKDLNEPEFLIVFEYDEKTKEYQSIAKRYIVEEDDVESERLEQALDFFQSLIIGGKLLNGARYIKNDGTIIGPIR